MIAALGEGTVDHGFDDPGARRGERRMGAPGGRGGDLDPHGVPSLFENQLAERAERRAEPAGVPSPTGRASPGGFSKDSRQGSGEDLVGNGASFRGASALRVRIRRVPGPPEFPPSLSPGRGRAPRASPRASALAHQSPRHHRGSPKSSTQATRAARRRALVGSAAGGEKELGVTGAGALRGAKGGEGADAGGGRGHVPDTTSRFEVPDE